VYFSDGRAYTEELEMKFLLWLGIVCGLVVCAQAIPSASDYMEAADADFNSGGKLAMPLEAPKLTEIGADDRLVFCQDESEKQCQVRARLPALCVIIIMCSC